MSSPRQPKMTRTQIGAILKRHWGTKAEIAAAAGVTKQTVTSWLSGKTTSAKIARCAEAKALECLAIEKVKRRYEC